MTHLYIRLLSEVVNSDPKILKKLYDKLMSKTSVDTANFKVVSDDKNRTCEKCKHYDPRGKSCNLLKISVNKFSVCDYFTKARIDNTKEAETPA